MQNIVPRFQYERKSPLKKTCGCIRMGDEFLHTIDDPDKFYKQMGYKPAMALNGTLPEEYIFDTFFKYSDRNCESCYQLRMIEYLLGNSSQFVEKYGRACDEWISYHSGKRASCNVSQCDDRKS